MIPPRFEYHAPKTVGEAVALLGQLGSDAKLLAGGHSLLPMMKLRFAAPEHLIDINRIPELKGIREEGGTVVIGAMTVENELISSPILQAKVPLLCEAAKLIADPQVRNRGTIGGDIAHGDPGNDHPALSIVIDASFVLEGPNGRRTVAAVVVDQRGFELLGGFWLRCPAKVRRHQVDHRGQRHGRGMGWLRCLGCQHAEQSTQQGNA